MLHFALSRKIPHFPEMTKAVMDAANRKTTKPLGSQGVLRLRVSNCRVVRKEAPPGFEPGHRGFDFHALWHQFISNLARAGVHPKAAQALARHSTITITLNCYTHVAMADLTGALDRLPALSSSE